MKKPLFSALLVASFFFVAATAVQASFVETFEDGSRSDGSPTTWVENSTTASNLSVVSDATMGSNVLQFNNTAGAIGTTLPTTYSLSTSATLSLSFDLRFTSGTDDIRIGLFNSGSSALPTSDGSSVGTNTSDDQGLFVNIAGTASNFTIQANADGGTNSGVFYGTDRTYGATYTSTSALGTTSHHVEITYLLSGSNAIVKVYIDSTLYVTQTLSTSTLSSLIAADGVNEIVFLSTTNSGYTQIDNITLTVIPEPKASALLFGVGGVMTLLYATVRRLKGLQRRFVAAK